MHLSKSQYMRGLQCRKSLWLYHHRRDAATPPDQRQQGVFETGHRVGRLAQGLFPGGVEIEHRADDFDGMIEQTRALVEQGASAIYEATFGHDGVLIMVDILARNGDCWDVYEVKSSTGLKPEHLPDVAIQWHVLQSQLRLGGAYLVHIDRDYVFDGRLDLRGLFAIDDLTDAVKTTQAGIAAELASMRAMLAQDEPDIAIGPHCSTPYDCDFRQHCWHNVPSPSVFDLHRMSAARKFELYHEGKLRYADLCNLELNPVQRLQVDSALAREVYVERDSLREFLDGAAYPINFLDFETFNSAIPRFAGQQPYRTAIPFQYSLHILHADGTLEHRECLADETADPRPEIARRLAADITPAGSIVAFSQATEKSIIGGLARQHARHAEKLAAMDDRFIDLLRPFRQLMYYHPDFNGSFSIKSILPAMFPDDPALDYKALEIQSGDIASMLYADLEHIGDEQERSRIREALREYCRLDTLAMVMIWRELERIAA